MKKVQGEHENTEELAAICSSSTGYNKTYSKATCIFVLLLDSENLHWTVN